MKRILFAAALAALLIAPAHLMAYGMTEFTFTNFTFNSGIWYGFSGDNHTYDYASYVDFYEGCMPDGQLGGTYIGTRYGLLGELNWGHTLPSGLMVPPDHVSRAKLWIDAWEVDDNDNYVHIEGLWDWDPLNHTFLDNTVYNMSYVDQPGFWNDGVINVGVVAGEKKLRIDGAALMMDYCRQVVPEPGTLVLLGMGLTAIGLIRRRSN